MLKPVQFLKPCVVNGPLYQTGDVAGFMPELAARLVADGSARELADGGILPAPEPPASDSQKVVGTLSGFPQASAEERQALRAGAKKPGGKK